MSNKFTKRPTASPDRQQAMKFHRFDLKDNPFPNEPYVNKQSSDSRINGDIYDDALRIDEHAKLGTSFIEPSRNEGSHLKLGYIEDASYLGRGNGKSAFILNASTNINSSYCLDLSNNTNKCFSIVVNPQGGGKAKSFESFVDLLLECIVSSKLIEIAIGSLILEAVGSDSKFSSAVDAIENEESLIDAIYGEAWFAENKIDKHWIFQKLADNPFLREMNPDSPFSDLTGHSLINDEIVDGKIALNHYTRSLKRGRPRFDFVFNELPLLFLAAGFNGGFVFVDDFERIPEFQSARQKRDFAVELRSVLFDGPYMSSKYGFFSMLLILHAGVPRLIGDAWQASGINSRSPMNDSNSTHVIQFEKLEPTKIESLLIRYLDEFRIDPGTKGSLAPFNSAAVKQIAEDCEFNAGRILQNANSMLDYAANEDQTTEIDLDFVKSRSGESEQDDEPKDLKSSLSAALDLKQKAGEN